jgi:hypothetical protein
MPAISIDIAARRLANAVEQARPTELTEIQAELFPEGLASNSPSAADLARHVREGLQPEEVVDLWNVVFPEDRNVWFNEADDNLYFNEEMVGYAEAD